MALVAGEVIRIGRQIYRVNYVNESRAMCLPLGTTDTERGINISPNSLVERVDPESEEGEMAVAIPVAGSSNGKVAAARKRADKHAGIGTKKGTGRLAAAKAKAAKTTKEKGPCLCGCGERTSSYFAMGHDAKFKSWMVKIERGKMRPEELPASVRKSVEFKKKGAGFVTTHNYKGEKHSGYDRA